MRRAAIGLLLFALVGAGSASAQTYLTEPLRIPMSAAGPQGLEALLVRPAGPGRFPLALIAHGSPRDAADRPGMTPQQMLPQAMEFARRGFAAAIVIRRGYGTSGGGWAETYGPCNAPDYVSAGHAAAADLKAAVAALAARPDVDASRTLAVGVSAGGFAVVALTEDPPAGLRAGISFAGARGSTSPDTVCGAAALADAFRTFGRRSRVPMLWVFAANDHFFGPELADRLAQAFSDGGGRVELKHVAAFGADGHALFSAAGRPVWTPLVDAFLAEEKLRPDTNLLPLATTNLPPPPKLSAAGHKDFEAYLEGVPHKAFAISAGGGYGWRTARRSDEEARQAAIETCEKATGARCTVYAVDDAVAR